MLASERGAKGRKKNIENTEQISAVRSAVFLPHKKKLDLKRASKGFPVTCLLEIQSFKNDVI